MQRTVPDTARRKKSHLGRKETHTLARMTQPKPRTQVTDPTGITVAKNVRRIREQRGLSTYDLARRLLDSQRPIAANALAKLERAERRTDAGDLVALAVALGVNPSALLLPLDDDPDKRVEITGAGEVAADVAWNWADGVLPLRLTPGQLDEVLESELFGRPPRRRRAWERARHLLTGKEFEGDELLRELRREGEDRGPSLD